MSDPETIRTGLGERGGSTKSFEAASALLHTFKDDWAAAVRADILDHLESRPEWHRDDLRVHLPADSKNVLGAVVNGLVRSGRIVETGERRASAEPASHGRKSNVYRLSQVSGAVTPGRVGRDTVSLDGSAVSAPPNSSHPANEGANTPAGKWADGRDGAREAANKCVASQVEPSSPQPLFELEPDRPGYYDREAA